MTWAAFACSSSTSAGPSATLDAAADAEPDAADTGAVCPLPGKYGSPACEDCLRASCCDEITTCVGDSDCAPLQTCALDCLLDSPDAPTAGTCEKNCEQMHAAGNAKWQEVLSCWTVWSRHDVNQPGCNELCTE